jgi:hypothetical protein
MILNFQSNENFDFNQICTNCYVAIEGFYRFKKQCQTSSLLIQETKSFLQKSSVARIIDIKPKLEFQEIKSSDAEKEETNSKSECKINNDESLENNSEENEGEASQSKSTNLKNKKKYVRKTQQCQICGKMVVSLKIHLYTHSGERYLYL